MQQLRRDKRLRVTFKRKDKGTKRILFVPLSFGETMLEHPPFLAYGSTRDDEEPPNEDERVPFYALAYARCLYGKTYSDPVFVVVYLCFQSPFSRFIVRSCGVADGKSYSYHPVMQPFDNVAGALLELWMKNVSPFILRLQPRQSIGFENAEHEKQYEQERQHLCQILRIFRIKTKSKSSGLFQSDPSFLPLELGQSPEEDEEIAVAARNFFS